MIDVEDIANIKADIKHGKLIVTITAEYLPITELRILKFLKKAEQTLQELQSSNISSFTFLFNIDNLIIPSNFTLLKEFADLFRKFETLIMDKLDISVFQCKHNIFTMFFSIFKSYYAPIKPLYLCKTIDEVNDCIHNIENRSKYPNICNML